MKTQPYYVDAWFDDGAAHHDACQTRSEAKAHYELAIELGASEAYLFAPNDSHALYSYRRDGDD